MFLINQLLTKNSTYMKSTINTELKPNTLILERTKIENEIRRYWGIIKDENVIKKNQKRTYDMKQLLIKIKALSEQLVIIKLRIQCINLGLKLKDLPKDANIINIYKLDVLDKYYVKLTEILKYHTINPVIKAKKGKRNISVTEELTYKFVSNKINECKLELNELRKKITDFNDNTDMSDDTVPLFLVA